MLWNDETKLIDIDKITSKVNEIIGQWIEIVLKVIKFIKMVRSEWSQNIKEHDGFSLYV